MISPDPLAAARARGVIARQHLIERAGGLFGVEEAAKRLGISTPEIDSRRRAGLILGVQVPDGEWVFPACQFTDDGVVPGLAEFLREFETITEWTQLAVLLAESARYSGRSALELLRAGEVDAARSVAAVYGEQD